MASIELDQALLAALAACFIGGAALRLVARRWAVTASLGAALAGSQLVVWLGVRAWVEPAAALLEVPPEFELLLTGRSVNPDHLHAIFSIDALSAFFLLLSGFLSSAIVLYSHFWLRNKAQAADISAAYNLLMLFTVLLLITSDLFIFLILLELMTLTFSYLTLYRHNRLLEGSRPVDPAELHAARLAFKSYLVFSHMGVMFITAAFVLLGMSRGTCFNEIITAGALDPTIASAVFLLALAGFGIKAAAAPFHPWMALTHPYLPTNVHALVSSIVVKSAGIYGLIRVTFQLLTPVQAWWGWLLLIVAGATALAGVFNAIISRDLKTALANHSVENIGIILAGLGLALLLRGAEGIPAGLPALALTAALYHLLNHSIFKSLLFLGAGAVENRTGSVRLEDLGGLLARYPRTAWAFIVGALAIAGFPPFNGFISEWLTLQSFFAGMQALRLDGGQLWLASGVILALIMLAAAFALTALAFVKIIGETFLGAPRRPEVLATAAKHDIPALMWAPMAVLAGLCLALGVFPGSVSAAIGSLAARLTDAAPSVSAAGATGILVSVPLASGESYSAALSMLPVLGVMALPVLALLLWRPAARSRRTPLWNCGTPYQPETMQITGGAFAFLIWERSAFQAGSMRSADELHNRLDPVPWRLPLSATRFVRGYFRWLYNRLVELTFITSQRFGEAFQRGDIRFYLFYIFLVFLIALLAAIFTGRGGQ